MKPSDMCRVTNHDTKILKLKYDGQTYLIDPDQTVALPAACAFLWFGDPRTTGSVPSFIRGENGRIDNMLPARTQEVTRLRFKWGADLGGDEQGLDGVELPKVTVTDIDGNEIVMVIHDPEGNHATPIVGTTDDNSQLVEMIQRQQKQIDLLMSKLNGGGEATSEDELPTDDAATIKPFKGVDLSKGIPAPTLSEVTGG
jgi:hypothetical protein